MMTPVEPSSPAAAMISRIVWSNCCRTASSSDRMKPWKPAQIALTLMLRPCSSFCSSPTRAAKPAPPGSKPTTPFCSMKSNFCSSVSPGAVPSWNESFSSVFFFLVLSHPASMFSGLTAATAPPTSVARKKSLLFIFLIVCFGSIIRPAIVSGNDRSLRRRRCAASRAPGRTPATEYTGRASLRRRPYRF